MGAAWRDMSGRKRGFERILKMVEGVRYVDFTSSPIFALLIPFVVQRSRHGGLHNPRYAESGASGEVEDGWFDGVQPQPRHFPRVLPQGAFPGRLSATLLGRRY